MKPNQEAHEGKIKPAQYLNQQFFCCYVSDLLDLGGRGKKISNGDSVTGLSSTLKGQATLRSAFLSWRSWTLGRALSRRLEYLSTIGITNLRG